MLFQKLLLFDIISKNQCQWEDQDHEVMELTHYLKTRNCTMKWENKMFIGNSTGIFYKNTTFLPSLDLLWNPKENCGLLASDAKAYVFSPDGEIIYRHLITIIEYFTREIDDLDVTTTLQHIFKGTKFEFKRTVCHLNPICYKKFNFKATEEIKLNVGVIFAEIVFFYLYNRNKRRQMVSQQNIELRDSDNETIQVLERTLYNNPSRTKDIVARFFIMMPGFSLVALVFQQVFELAMKQIFC